MEYTIKNDYLQVSISTRGAEMQSIKSNDGTEYLWQGNPEFWRNRATNIFPYVGRMTNGKYRVYGNEYEMRIHGFLCEQELEFDQKAEDCIEFKTSATEETKRVYPFAFHYAIEYKLDQNQIKMTCKVENAGTKTMFFGIGGHPGFVVPMGEEGAFEDCCLEFGQPGTPTKVGLSATCYVNGQDEPFPLRDEQYLDLRHDLFDNDAIVLTNMSTKVSIRSRVSDRAVEVEYPQMKYLGIWHAPKKEPNYVCIEPWSSLPSADGVVEDLETQENLVSLEAGKVYENKWSITIK